MTDIDIDIDAIRQREQAATKGPWDVFGASQDDDGRDALIVCHTAGDRTDPAPLAEIPFNVGDDLGDVHADAEFIAHARTDVPALLAKVDELTAALAQSREQAATDANEIGSLKAELERLRQQRDEPSHPDLGGARHHAPNGCDDCSVEPGDWHRYPECPGNLRAIERAKAEATR